MINKVLQLLTYSFIVFAVFSCEWSEQPNTYSFVITNSSSYSFRVDFSTIKSADNTLQIGRGENRVNLLDYTTEDEFDEPTEGEFKKYIKSINIFIDDSLVYTQYPVEKRFWELYNEITDDGFTQYYYSLTIVDSMLSLPWLELINSYDIDVEEPSGLDLSLDNNSLWTVSDKRSKIYQLDLTGNILQEINIPATDLEGITIDNSDNSVWVVLEGQGEILNVDILGNEIQRITIPAVRDGSGGLEGITLNSMNNHLFLLKEKDPGVLIELDTEFEILHFKHISTALDYSGMDYDEIENELWIVSDQDKKVYRYDLGGNVIDSYPINVEKAEGIAFDSSKKLVYIVSDSADSLFVYKYNSDNN